MTLCADGKTIRNEGRFKSYKGQLYIYNYILGKMQNYTPNQTFIMAKNWKIDKTNNPESGYSCYDIAGVIDYAERDNIYIKKTRDAINWINTVRKSGLCYSPLNPTIKEMCVNASNQNDQQWTNIKKEIIKQTKDITAVWQLTQTHRDKIFDEGIRSWNDPRCNSKNLGLTDGKKANTIDKILEINRQNDIKIMPRKKDDIKDNRFNWKKKYPTDFYIDFETISEQLGLLENINIYDSRMNTQIIFMIGIGYEFEDRFHYKVFKMNEFNLEEEKRIVKEFKEFIDNLCKDLDEDDEYYPRFFHWSHAEKTMLDGALERHPSLNNMWLDRIGWIDLCDIFTNEPIVVKGALSFKLKEIGNAMFSNGLISTYWDTSDMSDGLTAMTKGIEYYNKENKTDDDEKTMESIVKYNKIDCKVLWDMVKYFRNS